jgi:hypothetical protein
MKRIIVMIGVVITIGLSMNSALAAGDQSTFLRG